MGLGAFGGFDDFLLGRVGASVGDVFADGGGEEERVLEDDADLVAEGFFGEVAEVVAVEEDANKARKNIQREEGKWQAVIKKLGLVINN